MRLIFIVGNILLLLGMMTVWVEGQRGVSGQFLCGFLAEKVEKVGNWDCLFIFCVHCLGSWSFKREERRSQHEP